MATDKTVSVPQLRLENVLTLLRASHHTVCVMPAVDKRYSDGIKEGLVIAIEIAEKELRKELADG